MKNHRRKPNAGVSLLEIMIVLAIIALIVGLTAPRIIANFGRAKSQVARVQMTNIKGTLQLYYIDVGRYPTESEGLGALLTKPATARNWAGPYIDGKAAIQDPWGRIYIYRFPGKNGEFDLLSLGRDGQVGGTKEDSDINL